MKKSLLFFVLILLIKTFSFGQEKSILVYDLVNNTWDSILPQLYDTAIQNDKTPYNLGSFNGTIETLEQTAPSSNIYPNSQFTFKKRAVLDYDLTNYPVRTTIKIFSEINDTLRDHCSGNLISKKHVLTAAHCVANIGSNTLLTFDSLYVCPVFDAGLANNNFNCSYVSKIYFFKDWNIGGEDLAVLELEESIGASTGWLSIGFNSLDTAITDGIFYKFSYPSITFIQVDSNEYNGDSLYYNYGVVDIVTPNSIGISGTNGIPGESGSSIIKVKNNLEYTSYGALSFSSSLIHSRINNWKFYALENIIKDDLILDLREIENRSDLSVYPNPTNGVINLEGISQEELISLTLFDNLGNIVATPDEKLDISGFPNGIYFLKIVTNSFIETKKVMKTTF